MTLPTELENIFKEIDDANKAFLANSSTDEAAHQQISLILI